MMKRVISLIVCFVLCLGIFSGCGKDQPKAPAADAPAMAPLQDAPEVQPDDGGDTFAFDKKRVVLITEVVTNIGILF